MNEDSFFSLFPLLSVSFHHSIVGYRSNCCRVDKVWIFFSSTIPSSSSARCVCVYNFCIIAAREFFVEWAKKKWEEAAKINCIMDIFVTRVLFFVVVAALFLTIIINSTNLRFRTTFYVMNFFVLFLCNVMQKIQLKF